MLAGPEIAASGQQCFADGAVGIELPRALKARKLLILRNSKKEKNYKNTEPRYTRGTREGSLLCLIDSAAETWWSRCVARSLKKTEEKPLNFGVYCHLLIFPMSLRNPQRFFGHPYNAPFWQQLATVDNGLSEVACRRAIPHNPVSG